MHKPRPPTAPTRVPPSNEPNETDTGSPTTAATAAESPPSSGHASAASSPSPKSNKPNRPQPTTFDALVEHANGDTSLVEQACNVIGIEIDDIAGRCVATLEGDPDGVPDAIELPQDAIDLNAFKKKGTDSDELALVRWKHEQHHLFRLLCRTYTSIDGVRRTEAKERRRRPVSAQQHAEARQAESTRLLIERQSFANRIQSSVRNMRRSVLNRKAELQQALETEESLRRERETTEENKRIATTLANRIQQERSNARFVQHCKKVEEDKAKAQRSAAARQQRMDSLDCIVDVHRQRKADHLKRVSDEVQRSINARDQLHKHIEDSRAAERRKKEEQQAKEAADRELAKSVRGKILQDIAAQKTQSKKDHHDNMHQQAGNREVDRQHTIAESQRAKDSRFAKWRNAFVNKAKQRNLMAQEDAARRRATLAKARNDEKQAQDETLELFRLSQKKSQQHMENLSNERALRKEELRMRNEDRLEQVEATAKARVFREQQRREQWLARKAQRDREDREIHSMKTQLRQDRARMQLRMQQLEEAQKRGDVKTLEAFVEELDSRMAAGDSATPSDSTP